jgi:hypothetical protein
VTAALFAALLMATPTPSPVSHVPPGVWGGTGIALEVNASGARIELDCAHGTIEGPLALDAEGGFDLPGTLVRERPGPVRMDEEEKPGVPVRYSGRLEGETLTLHIAQPNAPRPMRPLTAELGKSPRLRKCG